MAGAGVGDEPPVAGLAAFLHGAAECGGRQLPFRHREQVLEGVAVAPGLLFDPGHDGFGRLDTAVRPPPFTSWLRFPAAGVSLGAAGVIVTTLQRAASSSRQEGNGIKQHVNEYGQVKRLAALVQHAQGYTENEGEHRQQPVPPFHSPNSAEAVAFEPEQRACSRFIRPADFNR